MKLKNKILISFSAVIILIVGIISLEVFSVETFRKLDTPYNVGTKGYLWEDISRYDSLTQTGRYLNVQAYYPTDTEGVGSIYHPNPELLVQTLSDLYELPKFLINRLASAKTNFIADASVSDRQASYPVLIFSHGMNGTRFQNSQQMEYLAGHGYIIFAVEHTHTSAGTLLPGNIQGGVIGFTQLRDDDYAEQMATRWSDDQLFVLNMLDQFHQNSNDDLFNSLDMNRIGVFGHSFGGLTSMKTLTRSDRFLTGINMDGYLFGKGHNQPFTEPYLEFRSPWPDPETASQKQLDEFQMSREYMKELLEQWEIRVKKYAPHGFTRILMHESNHMTFSDFLMMMPFNSLTTKNYSEQNKAVSEYVKGWFDYHLLGSDIRNMFDPGRHGFVELSSH